MNRYAGVSGALFEKLCDVARKQGTIFYGQVAPIAGVDTENPHFAALVGRLLDEINEAEASNGRPLLSAIVIGKENNMPGTGFFACARQLRLYSGRDDLEFWLRELKRVHDYWSQH
jgi:hypothetical protein